jgi:hypothetical protein
MIMRNFTFMFFFLLIGAIAFAQQPVVTPVWDNSAYGNADWSAGFPVGEEIPEWMGGTTERGMTHYDGKLYIVSRNANPPVLVVLDAATGSHLSSMPIDTSVVKGGTFAVNDIAITPSGKILVANLATNTHVQPFKVYILEEDGEGGLDATVLVEWNSQDSIDGVEQPFHRLGDGFNFYGDVSAEEDGYVIVGDANGAAVEPIVFRWDVQAGVAAADPTKIVLQEVYPAPVEGAIAKLGITPRTWPLNNDLFWADGHSTVPALYNMQGELISTFSGDVAPMTTGISGVAFFSFSGHDFILAPTSNHVIEPPAAFQLFLIPEAGAEEADSIAVLPERGLGKNTNASYAAPLAVDVQADMVMMYIMSPNNGIAAYKLTMEEEVSDMQEWNISDAEFNALGSLTETVVIDGLTIYAAEGKNVDIDENNKTLEDWVFTHRLKFGGSGGFDDDGKPLNRAVAFNVAGNSKITIALQSSSSSADRVLNVAVEHEDSVLVQVPALGASISKGEVEYIGGAATIYLYSPSSGVNIYLIKVEPLTVSAPLIQIADEVRVFPNPATDKVFVNVKRPTQVAIYNLAGSMVKSKLIESQNDYIHVNDLQPGMYLIKSQFTNDFTQKLIIR